MEKGYCEKGQGVGLEEGSYYKGACCKAWRNGSVRREHGVECMIEKAHCRGTVKGVGRKSM